MLTEFFQDSDFIVVLQTGFGSGFLSRGSGLESDSKKLSPNTSVIWRLLLEKSWACQRHRLRRNESLAMLANRTAPNAPTLAKNLLFSCLWERIHIWAWI